MTRCAPVLALFALLCAACGGPDTLKKSCSDDAHCPDDQTCRKGACRVVITTDDDTPPGDESDSDDVDPDDSNSISEPTDPPDPDETDPDPPADGLRVFVSSQRYPADLASAGGAESGLQGADNLCQMLADASELGGTWKAWLSTSSVDAIDRVEGEGPWYDMNGAMLFANKSALGVVPVEGLRYDERGDEPDPYYEPWTGTATGGRHKPLDYKESTTCYDWTSTYDSEDVCGHLGLLQSAEDWTDFNCGYCSPYERHIICFEQP